MQPGLSVGPLPASSNATEVGSQTSTSRGQHGAQPASRPCHMQVLAPNSCLPARSTRCSLERSSCSLAPTAGALGLRRWSRLIVKMAWLRLEVSFRLWEATARWELPCSSSWATSASVLTSSSLHELGGSACQVGSRGAQLSMKVLSCSCGAIATSMCHTGACRHGVAVTAGLAALEDSQPNITPKQASSSTES